MRYRIEGGNMPVVICLLEKGESMNTQNGGMAWMTPGMRMETSGGGLGKVFGRMISGETMFLNTYTAERTGEIAFAASVPGQIIAVDIAPGRELIAQKGAYLASETGVQLAVTFNKRVSSGFFGGEGFVMQKLSGRGTAFLEIDGAIIQYDLKAGEQLVIDTGYLAAMDATCDMQIQSVAGLKNKLLGGEGLFNTVVTGPGRVYLQTMPISHLAQALYGCMPHKS